MNAALLSSANPAWNTPESFLAWVRAFFGGSPACDPCSNPSSTVGAAVEYQLERGQDGLSLPWLSPTYMNPPYGKEIVDWVQAAAMHATSVETIGLLPSRTDARWFQQYVFGRADAVCFMRGRLRFVGAPASAPFPSAVVLWTPDDPEARCAEFARVFGSHGRVVLL